MTRRVLSIILIIVIAASCNKPTEKPSEDLSQKKILSQQLGTAVLWYQNSAEMKMLYHQAYDKAGLLLESKLIDLNSEKKPAVVLDIDETVLDNSPYEAMLIEKGITFGSKTWKEWIDLKRAAILPGVESFTNQADSLGVEVFYISNRTVEMLPATIENMRAFNLPNVDSAHIFLKSETSDKTERRNKVSENYNILVFIGDNLTDYSQMFADRDENMGKDLVEENLNELLNNFIMLPNPMYGEWEGAVYSNDYSLSDSAKLKKREEALQAY